MSANLEITVGSYASANGRHLSAERLRAALGITRAELAKLVGVARNTLAAGTAARKADQALSPLARILAMATEMAGSEGQAAIWFKHQPLPGWAGKTAYDLVAEGKSGEVLKYLESVRAGVYA